MSQQFTHKSGAIGTAMDFFEKNQPFPLPAEPLAGSRSTLEVLREFHLLQLTGSIHPSSDIASMLDSYAIACLHQISACTDEQLQNHIAESYAGEFRFLVNQLSQIKSSTNE